MRPNLPALKDAHHKIFYFTKDLKINGVTIGRGAGNISLNTAVGASALSNNTTGSNNTAVGYNAGSTITSGSFNTFIGYNARGSAGTNIYEIAIGNGALGLGSNTTVIGTNGATSLTTIYGALSLPDTTASTTTTTGALKVAGGAGIAGTLNVGAINVSSDLTVSGNLTINGTTTTVNSSTLTVDDKNIELGSVVSFTVSTTGTIGSITGTGPWTATITGMVSTSNLIVGSTITATNGVGSLGAGGTAVVSAIVSSTSVTYTYTGGTTPTAGTVTNITTTGVTDITANGGGITLKGATDKTIIWDSTNSNWTSSENWNIVTGNTYKINNVPVLTANSVLNDATQTSVTVGGYASTLNLGAVGSGTTNINTNFLFVGGKTAISTATVGIEVGGGRTGDGISYVDLIGDTTYTDYGLRLLRGAGSNGNSQLLHRGTGILQFIAYDVTPITFNTSNTERMRIDSVGKVIVGHTDTVVTGPSVTVQGTSAGVAAIRYSDTAALQPYFNHYKSRGGTVGTPVVVQSGDGLGRYTTYGYDGTNYIAATEIRSEVDGAPGTNDMPGRLIFSTTADGAVVVTERMRINSSGQVGIGISSNLSADLHIYSATDTSQIVQDANGALRLLTVGGVNYIQSAATVVSGSAADLAIGSMFNISEWMRIKASTGNVLIGTATDDTTSKLQVNGTVKATAFIGDATVSTSTLTVSSSLILPNTTTLPASPVTGNLRYNTTSNKFEGYSSVGWGSIGGGGLTPTPVKTAAYTAVANDLVRCNTSGGAFSITLPSSPADGDIVGIIDTNNSFASFNLTILPTVGKTIEGDSTSFILDVNGSYASFVYVLATVSTGNWKLQSTPLSTSPVLTASTSVLGLVKVDGTTITVNGSGVISASPSATKTIVNTAVAYTVTATDLGKIINCTSDTFTVSLTAAATLGSGFTCTIWNTNTNTANVITIDPAGSETIDNLSTFTVRAGEGLDIVCDGTNWQTSYKKTMRGYAENRPARPTVSGQSAVGFGNTTVSGTGSVGFGWSTVSGNYSFATGGAISSSTASASYSLAIGLNSAGAGPQAVTGAGAMALGGSYATGVDSFAAAIANNTSSYGATGANSVAIGQFAKANAGNAVAIGNNSVASGTNSFACGWQATASGTASVALGCVTHITPPTANADHSFAFGPGATSKSIVGKVSFASGDLIATSTYQSGIQTGILTLRNQTTDATPAVLVSDPDLSAAAATNQLILPNKSVYGFTGTISAMQSAAGGTDFAIWEVKGGIRRGASAAAMTLGSYNINILSKSSGATAWTVALSADTTNGGLAITVTGAASVNIRWVASITTSEVTYA